MVNPLTKDELNAWMKGVQTFMEGVFAHRTIIASGLIPVSPYLILSELDAYFEYPKITRRLIEEGVNPAELGRRGRSIATMLTSLNLTCIFTGVWGGRHTLITLGEIDPNDQVEELGEMVAYWREVSRNYRCDGAVLAWDNCSGNHHPILRDEINRLEADCHWFEGDREKRQLFRRFLSALSNYNFLVGCDSRVFQSASGPYAVGPDLGEYFGTQMVVREFLHTRPYPLYPYLEPCQDVPYDNLLVAFILKRVEVVHVVFPALILTKPEDYLDLVVACAVYHLTYDGRLELLPFEELAGLTRQLSAAHRKLYAHFARMERKEKILAGTIAYKGGFIHPAIHTAGLSEKIDLTIQPRALSLYPRVEDDAVSTELTADFYRLPSRPFT